MIILYHNDMSVCAQKVRMILAHKGLDWESQHLNLREGDQHKPAFRKINPKGLVPVLVDNNDVVLESSVIVEYLEDTYPDIPIMPINNYEKAVARRWMIRLDAGLHAHVATISFCCAFKYQLLSKYSTQSELEAFLDKIPDVERAALLRDTLQNNILDSQRLQFAVAAYAKLLTDMSKALKGNNWLVGSNINAVDYSFIPYLDRLEQLGLKEWWQSSPEIGQWLNRVRDTDAYKKRDWGMDECEISGVNGNKC